MDPQVLKLVNQHTPKFNPDIANGLAVKEVNQAMEYVDNLFNSVQSIFPEGLTYLGVKRVSPEEEYATMSKNKIYDISKSTIYLVKVMFEYQGEVIRPYYLALPYLEAGGKLMISGSSFVVSPVLIDRGFSVGKDSIFVYLGKTKATFKQVSHVYIEDDKRVSAFAVSADMYYGRNSGKVPNSQLRETHKMASLAAHYLFAVNGVKETFMNRFGVEVHLGNEQKINHSNFPKEEWVICRSTKTKPKSLRVKNYIGSNLLLAIRRDDLNIVTRGLIASIFYIVDWYPSRVNLNDAEGKDIWYLLLALTLKPDVSQEFVTLEKLADHIKSSETFVDAQVRHTLASTGLHVNDVYDILEDVIRTYPDRINISNEKLTSMYGKRLVVLMYLLSEIRDNIFGTGFDFQALVNSGKEFGRKEIEKILTNRLKTMTILKVNREHPEVASVSNPTDNIVPTLSLQIKLQPFMKKKKGKKNKAPVRFSSEYNLSASIAEVGNLTSDAKDDMTGRSRLNPYCLIDYDGTVIRNHDLAAIVDKTQMTISRE